jgi:two-component system, OmpR family, sensor kinase
MPSVAAIIFPFRRLAIWLSVLVLAVAALALGITALLVVPSLRDNLVNARVGEIDRSAKANIGLFLTNKLAYTEAVTAYEQLTGNRVVVLATLNERGDFLQVAGNVPNVTGDPLAREARLKGPLSRAVRSGKRFAAETAIPIGPTSDRGQVVLLFMSSLNDVDRTVDTVQRDVLIAVAIALPASWLVGLLAAFALAARIRRLERATRRIAAGNLATPVTDDGRDEIHELARAFDDMRRRLERTDRARREFIANASHELRTPLFALGGFLELLEDEEDPAARREFVATMHGQVSRLTRLATDLLDLSRLDAGGVQVARDEVDIAGVAALAAQDFAATAEQRGSSVTAAGASSAVAIADEARVAQIARVLVDNALRHNPSGVEVTVTVQETNGNVELVVADNGPPIDPSTAERLFDRFFRGPTGGEGSGLGLAIANELAQRMDGELVLDQRAGRAGKSFRLTLPGALHLAPTMLGA